MRNSMMNSFQSPPAKMPSKKPPCILAEYNSAKMKQNKREFEPLPSPPPLQRRDCTWIKTETPPSVRHTRLISLNEDEFERVVPRHKILSFEKRLKDVEED